MGRIYLLFQNHKKMKSFSYTLLAYIVMQSTYAHAQNATTDTLVKSKMSLNEFVLSANKVNENKKNVAQQVTILNEKDIANAQAQSTADLMSSAANLFVQKSQLGGGSPVIRGFEANRIQMVVDGVRMNNLIYRAGHLQNIVTIDNSMLSKVEVLSGPSSTIYGSDALGGVICFYSKSPQFSSKAGEMAKSANAFIRYGSVNNEMTGHGDFSIGGKRFASLTSVTYSSFGDLKGGESKNMFYDDTYGERPYYVKRIGGKDSLVANSNKYLQVQSAYAQYDLMQKFAFKQSEHVTHGINLQFSNSTDVPRYDRLTDPSGSGLKNAQWYYGPQTRFLGAYDLNIKNDSSFFQAVHVGANYQSIDESRHSRGFNKSNLANRDEKVNVMGLNIDLNRSVKQHNFRIGFDGQYNTLKSTANAENINTGVSTPLDTRYPDGDNTMSNMAVYGSHTMAINDKFTLTDGLRLGYISLHSTFSDTSFFHLPYSGVDQKNLVYSGSIGLIHAPTDKWKLSLLLSTGFRAPNVDDLSKVFESAPGALIVPNKDLKPEKTINAELGITKLFGDHSIWENALYYTSFVDAIVTDRFKYNGQDSVMYDGSMSKVFANQNQQSAYVYGFSSNFRSKLSKSFELGVAFNYTYGRINTDSTAYPLDHIPPMMLKMQLSYNKNKFRSDFIVNYNGAKNLKDYYLNGEDNEQYATKDGMPAWMTANLRVSYQLHKMVTVQAGVDNILDTQYRTFASGINAPGRNIFCTVRFHY